MVINRIVNGIYNRITRHFTNSHLCLVRSEWKCYNKVKDLLRFKNDSSISAISQRNDIKQNSTIWMYWRQGEKNAPDLVKKCIASVRKNAGNYDVVVLSADTLPHYIKMPVFIENLHDTKKMMDAHYSDLVRISLLLSYGGIWCDATCFWSDRLPKTIENSDFFVFSTSLLLDNGSPIKSSNWFIKAKAGNLILKKIRNVLFHYYAHNNKLIHYFVFHCSLSRLIDEDPELNVLWSKMPYICNMNPHVLQFSFGKPYTVATYNNCIESCFVHKLTYKFDRELLNTEKGNVLQHFMKNN